MDGAACRPAAGTPGCQSQNAARKEILKKSVIPFMSRLMSVVFCCVKCANSDAKKTNTFKLDCFSPVSQDVRQCVVAEVSASLQKSLVSRLLEGTVSFPTIPFGCRSIDHARIFTSFS